MTNVLDMVSVLISVVSNTESTHGQSAEDSRKAAFTLFKKLKVCACIGSRSDFKSKIKHTKIFITLRNNVSLYNNRSFLAKCTKKISPKWVAIYTILRSRIEFVV